MKQLRKYLLLFPLLLTFAFGVVSPVMAAPYEGYNYSWWGEPEPAPVPYLPIKQIRGEDLAIGGFNAPEDVYTKDGLIYVLDSGNNRIVIMDDQFNVVRVLDTFVNNGKEESFNAPQGIFVHHNNHIFIADTGNKRVVELAEDGTVVRIIGAPQSEILPENFNYEPIKLAVDIANRLYVIAKGVFEGVLEFDAGGKFTGFMGTNKVKYNVADLFWKRIMTAEQRSKMVLFIPVEFNNIDIDDEGFIFVTTGEAFNTTPVQRLNPSGVDVLKRIGYQPVNGDTRIRLGGTRGGSSSIISVAYDTHGMYSILDNTRGRIFTYDRDGKLLYVYGLLGEQKGTFKTPTSIAMLDDRMLVIDKGLNHLVVFEPTRYGSMIRDAVIYNEMGEEEKSVAAWQEALEYNSNLDIAYLGIGKAHLRQGHNLEAMDNFRLGMHREYYSRAFERYRKEFMWEHFGKIAAGILVGIVLLLVGRRFIKAKASDEPSPIGVIKYTLFHPFNGFWDIKYEKKGRVWLSLLILFVLSILMVLKKQYTGFIFNPSVDQVVNTFDEIKFVVLPFFLWCVANWSLTTLMDGEGKFSEIVIATSYALVPLLLVQIPLILMSNIITVQEGAFYGLILMGSYIWCGGLLFVGMLTVHQYSASKTIVTMFLTLVVIGIILFLGLLFFSLIQQMLSFGSTIYKELLFRFGEG